MRIHPAGSEQKAAQGRTVVADPFDRSRIAT
jgi:hypothetical protein